MRKSRFTESQTVSILKEGEAGVPLADLVRKHGISRGSYFNCGRSTRARARLVQIFESPAGQQFALSQRPAEYSEGAIRREPSSRRVRASASDCIESVSAPPGIRPGSCGNKNGVTSF